MLPDGWTQETLGSLATLERGRFSARPRNDPKYFGGEVPFVQTGDVANAGRNLSSYSQTLNSAGLSVSKMFPVETILITIAANIGATAITTFPVACPDSLVGIRAHAGKADTAWLKYSLDFCQASLDSQAGQNAQKNINLQVLEPLKLHVPPLCEQQRIGALLSTWDAAIDAAERFFSNSRRRKLALMHTLLIEQRFSRKRASPFVRQHAAEIFTPISIRRNDDVELLSVTQDHGVIPRRLLDRKVVMPEGSTDTYKLVEPGDFIISLRSFEGGLEYSRFRGLVSPAYTVLRAKVPIHDDFYRHYFKSTDFIGRLAVAVIGIRDGKQISYDDFAFLKIPVPAIEEQRTIAAILDDAEREMSLLAAQIESLRLEKLALMDDLLTGKRRVHAFGTMLSAVDLP